MLARQKGLYILLGLVVVAARCVASEDLIGWNNVYVYASRDSLDAIALSSGMTKREFLSLNKLTEQTLRDGQVLVFPSMSSFRDDGRSLPDFFSPREQMSREIWRGVRGFKRVAFTFDAGGDLGSAPQLLETLTQHRIPATFFVTGKFARSNPEWTRHVATSGYRIYNHSWSHPHFTQLTDRQIEDELLKADEEIRQLTGYRTLPFWRPPYGESDRRVLRVAAGKGFRSVYWTVDSLDSYGEEKTASFLVERVLTAGCRQSDDFLDGAIVLFHVNYASTAEAIPKLAEHLMDRGFRLVSLDEILSP